MRDIGIVEGYHSILGENYHIISLKKFKDAEAEEEFPAWCYTGASKNEALQKLINHLREFNYTGKIRITEEI